MNHSKVNGDYEEIETFARKLETFEIYVREQYRIIHASFSALEESWTDAQQNRFKQMFEENLRPVTSLLDETENHVAHLLKKAEQLRAFANE